MITALAGAGDDHLPVLEVPGDVAFTSWPHPNRCGRVEIGSKLVKTGL